MKEQTQAPLRRSPEFPGCALCARCGWLFRRQRASGRCPSPDCYLEAAAKALRTGVFASVVGAAPGPVCALCGGRAALRLPLMRVRASDLVAVRSALVASLAAARFAIPLCAAAWEPTEATTVLQTTPMTRDDKDDEDDEDDEDD